MRNRPRRRMHGFLAGALLTAAATAGGGSARAQDSAQPPAAPTPATPARETAAQPASKDRRESARLDAEKALRIAMIPAPMTAERFGALLAAIDPTLVTNADLASQFALYAEQAKTAIDAQSAKIADRLPAAYSFDAAREEFVARPNPELVQALVLRGKAMSQVLVAERALLRAVMLATPAERKIRFVEERLAWLDERTPRNGLLPSTKLTLFEVVRRARVSPESLAAAEPILVAHADRLATLRENRSALLRDGDLRRARIETDAGTLWRLGPADTVRTIETSLVAVDDAEFATEVAIREQHFQTLDQLRRRLNAQEGRRVVEEWQRSVHPELFDDERLLSRLVESVLALPSSPPETDEAILDAVDTAFRRLEPLARDAARAADLVLPRLVERSDEAVLGEIAARLSVLSVQTKRRGAIRDLVTVVRGIASTSEPAVLAQFASLGETLASLDRADAFDRTSLETLAAALAARAASGGGDANDAPATKPGETASPAQRPQPPNGQTEPSSPARKQDGADAPTRSGRGSRRQQP